MEEHKCGVKEESCVCSLPDGHEDKWHRCDCGGEWSFAEGHFEFRSLPGSDPNWEWPSLGPMAMLDLLMRLP